MNILEVQDLCKTYGTGETEVHALNHVSFSVRKGEFIAIIGESGSGKSTLLNVVGALDSATSGKVWIDGQDIFSMPEKKLTVFRRQHIGFIFQSFNLIPELNVEQNITFPLLLDYKKPNHQDGVNWNDGDTIILHISFGDKQVTVAGILATAAASAVNGAGSSGYMICSEQTFTALVGDLGYTTIDVQFSSDGGDDTVSAIRSISPPDSTVSDKRITNSESQSSYYTGAVFIYGFLIIIALITVFNIFNSMNASVASRTRQYGIMRSIGMGENQLYKMIAAESFTYAILGCIVGCVLGLPLSKLMFRFLITDKWGTVWQVPADSLFLIVFLCLASAAVAIRRPIRQISRMSIVDIIKLQQ